MRQVLAGLVLVAGLVGCGGDGGTGPSATYEDVAGSYSGGIQGISQGVALNATFALTISQSQGTLSGTYSTSGTLSDGFDVVGISGTGTITGTIASGANPSINFAIRNASCPNQAEQYSGTYDSVNRRINAQGTLHILAADCSVLLAYPMNVVLQR